MCDAHKSAYGKMGEWRGVFPEVGETVWYTLSGHSRYMFVIDD